jgi:hypothetical protein
VVEKVVSELQAAGVSAEGEIRETRLGHVAAAMYGGAPSAPMTSMISMISP